MIQQKYTKLKMENGMNDKIMTCSDLMLRVTELASESNKLNSVWRRVVSKINSNQRGDNVIPIGERLAGNTRVIDIQNGILLIETDHSGWIQYLKFYQKFIITGLKREIEDLNVNSFAFRLSGSNALLAESKDKKMKKEINDVNEKFEKIENEVNKIYADKKGDTNKSDEKKSTLPPELYEKLENIKRSMLTNSSK
jgi:hypothetical protein